MAAVAQCTCYVLWGNPTWPNRKYVLLVIQSNMDMLGYPWLQQAFCWEMAAFAQCTCYVLWVKPTWPNRKYVLLVIHGCNRLSAGKWLL